MANAFTPSEAYNYGGSNNQDLMEIVGTLVIDTTASGGAAADDLPASLFGLKKLLGIAIITNDGEDKNYIGTPDYTGDSLLVGGGEAGALQDLPNDTYRVIIRGRK